MHFLETEFFHPLKEKNLLQISNGAWAKRCFQIVSGVLRIEGLVRLAQWFLHCWVMNWILSSLFSSPPAQLQVSSALVPVSLLLHRKMDLSLSRLVEPQPRQHPAPLSITVHSLGMEGARRQGGPGLSKGCPQEWGCYSTPSC